MTLGGHTVAWMGSVDGLMMCVCVCAALVVDGGAAEAAAGRRELRLGGLGPDSDSTVSAAADGDAGGDA